MHGSICPANRAINDWIGTVAISLYAWFDYKMLHKKHWEHHDHTGIVGEDPDFHAGNSSMPVWFVSFMLQ
jgi:beta-carotene/zeaxanthin 4-ketolase